MRMVYKILCGCPILPIRNTVAICDVSSEKEPEPPYVNIEKIAKTRLKVNFAEFLFISLNDYLPIKEWFLRVWWIQIPFRLTRHICERASEKGP